MEIGEDVLKWIEKYRGGFSNGSGFETVEFLLSKKLSSEKKLAFQAYDANLCPLPDASQWNIDWLNKQVQFLNQVISKDFHGEVWLDDVMVRGGFN